MRMLMPPRRAQFAALVLLVACKGSDSPAVTRSPTGAPIARSAIPGAVTRSPEVRVESTLPAGDSVVDLAASFIGPELSRANGDAERVASLADAHGKPITC